MAGRKHLVAVNRTIAASGLDRQPGAAAAVVLVRNLARRLDRVGADEASLGLLTAYQSAVGRVQRLARGRGPGSGVEAAGGPAGEPDALEEFMRKWRVRPEDR